MTGLEIAFGFVFAFLVPTLFAVLSHAVNQKKANQEIIARLQRIEDVHRQNSLI
jgi:hypothetical protein